MPEVARRKILFVIPTLAFGGAERVVLTLLKHLDRKRFDLVLAVVDSRNAVYRSGVPEDVEFIDLGATRVRYVFPKVLALVWKLRPHVMFSTLGHLNLALAILRPLLPRNVRFIARETSILSCAIREYGWPWAWALLYRLFYPRVDLLVCQSREMQADLVGSFGFPVERSLVIHNPVDVELVRQRATEALVEATGKPGKTWLVAAGRMTEVKGFDLLIEAIALLSDAQLRVSLLGDGPLVEVLKRLAQDRGVASQIEFVGLQANPFAWFSRADAVVLSSRHEGFPNVVLEALTCGTPVIATPAHGGVREILDYSPECVMADEISAVALAKAISTWLAGARGRVSPEAVQAFAVGRIIEQYERVLDVDL